MSSNVQPSVSKNSYNCVLTSNGWNRSQSFLRGSSWVRILNLAQVKISISFVGQLINFLLARGYRVGQRRVEWAGRGQGWLRGPCVQG